MINFCLTVILLSAFRKIMYQIDSNAVIAFDNKLENAFLAVVGLIIFCIDIIKPTKIESAIYTRQKKLAVESLHLNLDSLKTVSERLIDKEINKESITLKLLPINNNDTSNYENQTHAA